MLGNMEKKVRRGGMEGTVWDQHRSLFILTGNHEERIWYAATVGQVF